MMSALAYNVASVVGTGLGTIFRYFSYKKWVFLPGVPGTAVAAGEAALSGIVDPAEISPSGAVLAGARNGYGPPWEELERPADLGHGPAWEHLDPAWAREHLDPAGADGWRR